MPWLCLRKSSEYRTGECTPQSTIRLTRAKRHGEQIRIARIPGDIRTGQFLDQFVLEDPERQNTSLLIAVLIRRILPIAKICKTMRAHGAIQ